MICGMFRARQRILLAPKLLHEYELRAYHTIHKLYKQFVVVSQHAGIAYPSHAPHQ